MTDWARLAEPFPDNEIKNRPGRGGMTFRYVDARAVAQRLDEVLTPEGWNFTASVIPGSDIVKGRLEIGQNVREDHGYPNSDQDDEPIKAATSDALKRCAVLFGIGRHLYDDNARPGARSAPRRPQQPAHPAFGPEPSYEPRRPHIVDTDILDPSDDDLDDLHGSPVVRDDFITCPIHEVKWAGEPGDLWHKDPDGRYCRHPDNVKRARAR